MLYVDYVFDMSEDGTVIFDKEIKKIPGAESGDEYVLIYNETYEKWAFVRKDP